MIEMGNELRVFFLEDNPDDVELELYELQKAGFKVAYDVARNRQEFLDKITKISSDILLADYSLPDITGLEAIQICKEMKIDMPVILLTGEGNELIAVDSLRLGAMDYIIKRNISGLPARVLRVLEIWHDRKAKERAEAEEMRLQQILFESQKMEAIGRLASGIAHDFNNILTGIMGYSELCIEDIPQDIDVHNKLQIIMTLSQRGADLVKQLLIYSKKVPMEFKIVDLNSFITETVMFLNRIVEETIDITLELHDEILRIRCDTGQFLQVLMNLTLNARDAMKGQGTITIKTEKYSLAKDILPAKMDTYCNECVCMSVSDTGAGIQENKTNKIFDPFFTTKEVGHGTGLGLAIVHSVIDEHGGCVEVLSEENQGTTFKIYLPLIEANVACETSQFRETLDKDKDYKLRGNETILFAEDEDVLRELITYVLTSFGYNVVGAKDGEEALKKCQNMAGKIDLVISDMLMPNKGGLDLFRELKLLNSELKFILITGYSLPENDRKTLDGMNAILTKPFSPVAVLRSVRDVIDS